MKPIIPKTQQSHIDSDEWQRLEQALPRARELKSVIEAGDITSEDAAHILMGDSPQTFLEDIQSRTPFQLDTVNNILERHGIDFSKVLHETERLTGKDIPENVLGSRAFLMDEIWNGNHEILWQAPQEVLSDETFFWDLLQSNESIFILEYASEHLRNDFSFMSRVITRFPSAVQMAGDDLIANPQFREVYQKGEIIMNVKRDRGASLRAIPEKFYSDYDFLFSAILASQTDPTGTSSAIVYDQVPPVLFEDPKFCLKMIRHNSIVLSYADPNLLEDRSFIESAIKCNASAIQYVPEELKEDLGLATLAAETQFDVIGDLPENIQQEVWDSIKGQYDWQGLISNRALRTYSDFKLELQQRYDIHHPGRFRSLGTLRSILNTRKRGYSDSDKPNAVLIFSKSDFNSAFEKYPTIDRLVELGYEVQYYEADSMGEVEEYSRLATHDGNDKADLLLISGHGQSDSLALADQREGRRDISDNDPYILSRHINSGEFDVSNMVDPQGDVILLSCSNGYGAKGYRNNVANSLDRTLPIDVAIHSSVEPMNIEEIGRNEDGEIFIQWNVDSLYVTD